MPKKLELNSSERHVVFTLRNSLDKRNRTKILSKLLKIIIWKEV